MRLRQEQLPQQLRQYAGQDMFPGCYSNYTGMSQQGQYMPPTPLLPSNDQQQKLHQSSNTNIRSGGQSLNGHQNMPQWLPMMSMKQHKSGDNQVDQQKGASLSQQNLHNQQNDTQNRLDILLPRQVHESLSMANYRSCNDLPSQLTIHRFPNKIYLYIYIIVIP